MMAVFSHLIVLRRVSHPAPRKYSTTSHPKGPTRSNWSTADAPLDALAPDIRTICIPEIVCGMWCRQFRCGWYVLRAFLYLKVDLIVG